MEESTAVTKKGESMGYPVLFDPWSNQVLPIGGSDLDPLVGEEVEIPYHTFSKAFGILRRKGSRYFLDVQHQK